MGTIWCNGSWREDGRLEIAAADRGLLHGLGLFETMLALDGRLPLWDRHLARLRRSCQRLGWPEPEDLTEIIRELLEKDDLAHGPARVRLTLTAGSVAGADGLTFVQAARLPETPAFVAAIISPWPRNERSPLAGLKCASYAENLLALDVARQAGCSEAIFFNTAGHLCEAAMANVFVVLDGRLVTPPLASGCLPGVARSLVLELSGADEADVTVEDLARAEAMFLTSATRGPVPVRQLDGREFPGSDLIDRVVALWRAALRPASG